MKISIIVPIFKVEDYINECIQSVLTQTYSNFELILVDDGSPDKCGEICDYYAKKDSRVKVLHKQNGGLVSARKEGAKLATGEYVTCLDGDDWLARDFCEKFTKIIEQYKPDICICGFINAFSKKNVKKPLIEKSGYYSRELIEKEIFSYLIEDKKGRYFSPTLCGKVLKKDLYIKSQLAVDSKIKIGEDQACSKSIAYKAKSLYVLNDCLYYYRQNRSSMTKNKSVYDLTVPKLIAMCYEKQIDMHAFDFQKQVYRHTVHDLFNACVSQFNGKDGYSFAKKEISAALNDEYYKTAIKNCKFSFFTKGWFVKLVLKYKLYFLIFLYNILK